jgi:UDP-glucose 4-epimerase
MKCVIFGGGGFIGSEIVNRLLLEGHSVRIFERPRIEPFRRFSTNEQVEWITGDFLSIRDVNNAIEGANVVLHLVSTTLPRSSNDDAIYDVQSNVVGTLQLLNSMVDRNVRRIVFISSGGTVYGIPKYLPIDEHHPTDPLVSYGIAKLTIEKYLALFERMHGIRAITLRVANPFGERQRVEMAQGAVGVFLHRALTGQPIEIWGDGTVTRDFVYVGDVARAFSLAMVYTGSKSVFNIGSGLGTSLNELITMLEEALGMPIERRYFPARSFDVPVSVLSNALALAELGWMPLTSMRQGIARTVEWMNRELSKAAN